MHEDWKRETARVVASFNRIAHLCRGPFADKVDREPFDRALFDALRFRPAAGTPEIASMFRLT
ncbi:MAG: hypothetical protein GEU78_18800 [Actinobacteria bacterium]|nr:hypothetical protein [Actinomycetota bacterium]